MIVNKIHFVIDESIRDTRFQKKVLKKYKSYNAKNSDVIVVVGGDGFMLETLKKYHKYKKPFYGINKGTFGFLMNKSKIKNLKKNIMKSKPVSVSPLQMKTTSRSGTKKFAIAINEVSLLRQSRQAASLSIKNGSKKIIGKLVSDGVLISTPAGSTAYNLSVHGPILSLNSKKLAITPISPFRPRRWKGSVVSDKSKISINNLDIKKRPVSVVADNVEFRNIKNVKIFVNRKVKFNLLYDSKNSLNKKIKIEQVRREIS